MSARRKNNKTKKNSKGQQKFDGSVTYYKSATRFSGYLKSFWPSSRLLPINYILSATTAKIQEG